MRFSPRAGTARNKSKSWAESKVVRFNCAGAVSIRWFASIAPARYLEGSLRYVNIQAGLSGR
jgi:hypothetical protein